MSRLGAAICLAAFVTSALTGCGEKAQTAATKKSDAKPWEGLTGGGNTAEGWKAGDQKGWEEHMRARTQGQNEYSRAPLAAK